MNVTAPSRSMSAAHKVEHFDVLIVGAGISGVGSAYHLTKQLPGTTFVVLEEQETFGGTWWTHKYPGIRSDNDLARHIRYNHRIAGAKWSSESTLWTVAATDQVSGGTKTFTANFLWM